MKVNKGNWTEMNIETAGHGRRNVSLEVLPCSRIARCISSAEKHGGLPEGGLCLGCWEVWPRPVYQEDDAKASAASEPLSFAHEAEGWQGKGRLPQIEGTGYFCQKMDYYCIQHLHWPLCHATSGSINTELLIWFSQGWEKPGNTSTVRSKEPLTIGRPAEVGLVATRSACCFCLAVPSRPWHGGLAGSIQSFTFAIGLGRKGSWGIPDERGWRSCHGKMVF